MSTDAREPEPQDPGETLREPARDASEVRAWHEDNRRGWNQGAVRYTEGRERTLERLRAGESNVHPVERANLADLGPLGQWCRTAIHLQCASGLDTLSLLIEGAQRVVGVDISDVHVDNARWIAAQLGGDATFHRCDVLDTPHDLDGTADLVYTGRGALNWLADLDAWAAVVARLLVPGGVVHVLDDHPFTWLVDQRDGRLVMTGFDYHRAAVSSRGWSAEYIGDLGLGPDALAWMHERVWTIADVVNALVGAGLRLERLGEHSEQYWDNLSGVAEDERRRLPMTFSLLARMPA
ncbi:MAG: class I SAM-dependent methyltransferase [Euzebyales bacterium]|nr:class I SAM-dependent methyltransferase [Euzebyales bacterium]